MPELRKMLANEFARCLKKNEQDKHYAFFIGAGCSISSGIPAAGKLVKDYWLPRLHDLRTPTTKDHEIWAKDEFNYDPNNPSASYCTIIEKLFPQPAERQQEIEMLCSNKFQVSGILRQSYN